MGRNLKRILFAIGFSAACYAGTEYWFASTNKKRVIDTTKPPIATLIDFQNHVQRKPLSRVIWETITMNELLYAGESIRTSSNSEAKIKFERTGTVIELEPDSLIVLEESKGKVTLNFLKGNIFLNNEKGSSGGKEDLTIKAGKSEIRATASTNLNLSGDSDGGKVNLDVFKGSAKLKGEQGKELVVDKTKSGQLSKTGQLDVQNNSFVIISPQANQTEYLDPRNFKPLVIKWKPLAPGYNIMLYTGVRRGKMKRNTQVLANGEDGQLTFKPKVGKFYWRLRAVAKNDASNKISTKVFPITVVAKTPPKLISPKNEQQVVLDSKNDELKIKWANKTKLKNLTLQVAKDKNFKSLVIKSQSLSSKKTTDSIDLGQPGTYFWRIVGYMKVRNKLEAIASPIQSFDLVFDQQLTPPRPKSPTFDQNINYTRFLKKGTTLTWSSVPGITKYQVNLSPAGKSNESSQSFEVSDTNLKLTQLEAGTYYWSVASKSKKGELSDYSKNMRFTLKDLPRIIWTEGDGSDIYLYSTEKPSINISWIKPNERIVAYRIRYSRSENGKVIKSKWKNVEKPTFNSYLPTKGKFEFIVEGLTDSNKIGARSLTKAITVKELEILPAPLFSRSLPLNLKSAKNGNLRVSWSSVKGAIKYKVFLKDPTGKVIKEYSFKSTGGTIKSLRPGDYKVSVRPVDVKERDGLESEQRSVNVPNSSNIKAPKLKGIKVR